MRKLNLLIILFFATAYLANSYAAGGDVSFYIYDRPNRSVTEITDTNSNILNKYTYDVFGKISSKTETKLNEFTYVGECLDTETSLIFLRNRYYDPALGRFITKDSNPGFSIIPQTKNPYPYCNNNPVNFEDPDGKVIPLIVAAVIASVAWGWYNEAMSALKAGGDYADINNAGAIGGVSNAVGTLAARVTLNPWLGGAVSGGISSFSKQWLTTGEVDPLKVGVSAGFSALTGGLLSKAIPLKAPGWLDVMKPRDLSTAVGADMERYVAKSLLSPTISNIAKMGYDTATSGLANLGSNIYADPAIFGANYGGVSLSKTAQLLTNLSEIKGAFYDDKTGQIILLGKQNMSLPQ
ncbi:MAG: RHS repeat-associated core domain-containing protein, partial [Candidatus Omnitrophica bacterium]|nr:RHS repeat-associated core domain-containing protein [Candidatus Omnitrophota bacterium]